MMSCCCCCCCLLQDGTAKLSKSAENDLSCINLTDSADALRIGLDNGVEA